MLIVRLAFDLNKNTSENFIYQNRINSNPGGSDFSDIYWSTHPILDCMRQHEGAYTQVFPLFYTWLFSWFLSEAIIFFHPVAFSQIFLHIVYSASNYAVFIIVCSEATSTSYNITFLKNVGLWQKSNDSQICHKLQEYISIQLIFKASYGWFLYSKIINYKNCDWKFPHW